MSPEERGWSSPPLSLLRDVTGPDFHGPSSSHTAGPQQIALAAHAILGGPPDRAVVTLYNSFASTGEGHKTPIALIAGLLGLRTTDPRTPIARLLADELGLTVTFGHQQDAAEHANAVVIVARRDDQLVAVRGISVGGGRVEVIRLPIEGEVRHVDLH